MVSDIDMIHDNLIIIDKWSHDNPVYHVTVPVL